MGGKHKQAQRTKNNARPSSSGRSAELLGAQAPKFVGLGAVKDGGYVAVLPGFSLAGSDVLDPNITADFQIVLKKMNKKDSTTKLKALQEFAELVGSSKEQDINAVLPFWPRLYGQLAVDTEHRVREAAHQAQHAVVRCMRRNLAPYLRQLIGPWFTSQHDTYSPAASAAAHSFQEAFPSNKVPEVIVFCQNEILNYIYDVVIIQKPQTVGSAQMMTKEEMEAKHERMLISSLYGYALYLDMLPPDKLDGAREFNKKIISCKKFWKYNKHPSPVVRGAWFKAVVALCRRISDLLSEESSQVTLGVFNNLDEADPVVQPAVWEAALHVLTTLQDCWAHVSMEKLVLPKLWNILRLGGQGSAATIYPNLLPLLSRIPDAVIQEKAHFFSLFFTNMRQGFSQKSVYQSNSESNAVTRCYTECLRFVLIKNFEKKDLCYDLIENHLVSAVELTLRSCSSHVFAEALYHHVSMLVCSWDEDERYSVLRSVFWRSIRACVLTFLHNETDQQKPPSWALQHILLLCCCLENPMYHKSRHRRHVKFAGEEASIDGEAAVNDEAEPSQRSQLSIPLQAFVQDVSKVCLDRMNNGGFSLFLPHFTSLLREFGCEQLLKFLSSVTGDNLTLLEWCKSIISKWLGLNNTCPQEVIKLAFILLERLPDHDKLPLLEHLSQVAQDGSLLVWFLQLITVQHHIPAVSKWLSENGCRTFLLSLARETLSGHLSAEARDIMKDILKRTPNGGFLLPMEVVESIISVYYETLSSSWDTLVDVSCVKFICELVRALYCRDLILCPELRSSSICEDLVLLLFGGSICMDAPYQELHAETTAAWEVAVIALSRAHGCCSETFREVAEKFAAILRQKLLEPLDPDDDMAYHMALDVALKFLRCSARDPTGSMDNSSLARLLVLMLDTMSCSLHGWQEQIADLCHYAMSAAGLLLFPDTYPGVVSDIPTDVPNFSRLFSLSLFSAILFARLYKQNLKVQSADGEPVPSVGERDSDECDSDSDDGDVPTIQHEMFGILKEHIISLLYSLTVGSTFVTHFRETFYATAIHTKLEASQSYSKKVLDALCPDEITELSVSICSRASKLGGLWLVVNNALPLSEPLDLSCFSRLKFDEIPYLHAVQLYPRLKASAKSEEYPLFIQDALDKSQIDGIMLAVVASCCMNSSFLGELDFLQRCTTYACERFKHETQLWFEGRDVATFSWEEVSRIMQMLNFMNAMLSKSDSVSKHRGELSSLLCHVTHDGMVVLLSLLRSLHSTRAQLLLPSAGLRVPLSQFQVTQVPLGSPDDSKVQLLTITALRLLVTVNMEFLSKCQPLEVSWERRYAEDVCAAVFELFVYIADHGEVHSMTCHDQLLLESLENAVMSFDAEMIFRGWETDKAVQFSCSLLTTTVLELQRVGHYLLKFLLKQLVAVDASMLEKCVADSEDEAVMVQHLNMWQLCPALDHTQGVMETLLSDFSLGDCCLVQPHTDAFAFAQAYLFIWDLLFVMCAHADTDLRFHYASELSKRGYVSSLLQILFRLMSEDVVQLKKPKNSESLQSILFCSGTELLGSRLTSEGLQDWVCLVYLRALQRLPAIVRQWWSGLDSRAATLVEQVTTQYMSPTLCSLEMESLQPKNGNMTVHVYGRAREVVAKYHVEDVSLELSVVLPPNHPLGPVKVESVNRQPMVEYANWRNWIMQLTVFLAHQNGSLWDGLNLWKSNLDKRFEGIEECYICFSILHGSNFQIPRIRCNTCKKKFHSHCMYKWFDTSNKSTCPICRNFIL